MPPMMLTAYRVTLCYAAALRLRRQVFVEPSGRVGFAPPKGVRLDHFGRPVLDGWEY